MAKREKIHVSCEVVANPSDNLYFNWVFNSSSERLDLQENLIRNQGPRSTAEHTPQTEMDYGSLMCWATNSIGRMEEPCIFHLIPAGRPDPVHNCSVVNQTYSTLHVECLKGFDGGLPQDFTMEVRDAKTSFVVANTTNTRAAAFTVTGLRPGTAYIVKISSSNDKGRSEGVTIRAYTSSAPINEPKVSPDESPLTNMGEFTFTPILAVLMTVGAALILVFVLIAAYFCVRRGPSSAGSAGARRKNENRISYTETHIALQKGIDDCINDDHHGGASGGTALTPMLPPEHERNPDIIPVNTTRSTGRFPYFSWKCRFVSAFLASEIT